MAAPSTKIHEMCGLARVVPAFAASIVTGNSVVSAQIPSIGKQFMGGVRVRSDNSRGAG
jgi:hypothetical protein